MNPSQLVVFSAIINCPSRAKETMPSDPCHKVVSYQKLLAKPKNLRSCPYPANPQARRQVREPWNGDIDNAQVLIIGSNPAFDPNEVFPNRDTNWTSWADFGDGALWTDKDCEDFFEGRFGKAICPRNKQPYFDLDSKTVLNTNYHSLPFFRHKVQNSYWETYDKYCSALSPASYLKGSYSFVVTDIVHCKSPMQYGVKQALPVCINHTKKIIDLFVANNAKEHIILLIGATPGANIKNLFGPVSIIGPAKPIGSYYDKTAKKNVTVFEQAVDHNGVVLSVFYNLLAPSGMNRAFRCPITIKGQIISW